VLSGLCGEILLGMASNFMKFHTRCQGVAVTTKNSIIIFGVFVVELWPNARNSSFQAPPDLKIGPNKSQIPISNDQNIGNV
jgi:hypothetical protein